MIVWTLTTVEVMSGLARRRRAKELTDREFTAAAGRLRRMAWRWTAISDASAVEPLAQDLTIAHPLRAADATQLAAALLASGGDPRSVVFVTRDDGLAKAARAERFDVVRPRRTR